jgi:hypothetical protein
MVDSLWFIENYWLLFTDDCLLRETHTLYMILNT